MGIEALFEEQSQAEGEAPAPEPVIETPEPQAEAIEPTPEPEPVAAPEPAQEEAERHVPLATFLDKRDEARELKRRVAELEAQVAPKSTPQDMPDPIDDPRGFADWQQGQVQQALVAERFNISDVMARQTHGDDVVKTAADWATEKARADPAFHMQMMQQPHPLDWIVRQHKRDGILADVGDNVDEWFTREAAKRGYAPTPAPNAQPAMVAATPTPAVKPVVPPRSIASDAQAPATQGDASADFMAIFQR